MKPCNKNNRRPLIHNQSQFRPTMHTSLLINKQWLYSSIFRIIQILLICRIGHGIML
jgi:hypothetical protein